MIWTLIGDMTLRTGANGEETLQAFDVQDFGLLVDQVVFALEITERSSEQLRVRVHQDHAASADSAAFITTAPDPIPLTALNGDVPVTLLGTATLSTPSLRTSVGVSSAEPGEGSVTFKLYVGGRLR